MGDKGDEENRKRINKLELEVKQLNKLVADLKKKVEELEGERPRKGVICDLTTDSRRLAKEPPSRPQKYQSPPPGPQIG